jgi:menaquinone-dependent protoporphyrinogen oxidase
MRFLITAASRQGATAEIAEAIARTLREKGLTVDVRSPEQVDSLDGYDGVVLGSGVYMGQWLPAARSFVDRHEAALAEIPNWLFSSGPIGSPTPMPAGDPVEVEALMSRTKAKGHQTFAGKLDRGGLSFGHRLVARAVKAPEGDFRDWAAVRRWALEIAARAQPAMAG